MEERPCSPQPGGSKSYENEPDPEDPYISHLKSFKNYTGVLDNSLDKSPTRRIKFTKAQLQFLDYQFKLVPNPLIDERKEIAHILGLPEKNIKHWFFNRRAKERNRILKGKPLIKRSLSSECLYEYSKIIKERNMQMVETPMSLPETISEANMNAHFYRYMLFNYFQHSKSNEIEEKRNVNYPLPATPVFRPLSVAEFSADFSEKYKTLISLLESDRKVDYSGSQIAIASTSEQSTFPSFAGRGQPNYTEEQDLPQDLSMKPRKQN